MRRFGVLLALLVLVSALSVGTGQVSAAFVSIDDFTTATVSTYADSWTVKYVDFGNLTTLEHAEVDVTYDYEGDTSFTLGWVDENYNVWGLIYWNGYFRIGRTTTRGSSSTQLVNFYNINNVEVRLIVDKFNETAYNFTVVRLDTNEIVNWTLINTGGPLTVRGFGLVSPYTISVNEKLPDHIKFASIGSSYTSYATIYAPITLGMPTVSFHLQDGLTGSALSGVTVKENGQVLGTIDDGGSLELAKGTHTLTFEKQGYWSVTKTIDVQSDMSISVEMYPDSAAFRLENFPAEIKIPENTIYTLTFTLSPIDTSATHNTYLSLSGLSDVIEVQKDGSVISPEGGKYYLGDISSDVQVSIRFKADAVGQHGFTITIESHDAIMSKTYTTTKSVTYQVEPLPFSVQMPSEWQVGENTLRISESSGQSYLITAVLKDSQGNEVWSDSHAFSPYEAHTFQVNIPSEGSYTLELQFQGKTAVYSIQVNPAITLKTKTLTVEKGGEGVITLHFKNPSSDVQYYTIVVSGGFLPAEINQSISVAPLTEKDVSIAFAVPEDLTYDAYELNVQVLQGEIVFQDKVAVTIGDSGGFSLFGGGTSTSTWVYVLLGLLVLGGVVWALRRR